MTKLTVADSNLVTRSDHPEPATPATCLHGMVATPPDFSWNGEHYTGPVLASLDLQRAKRLPGVVDIIVSKNFVGVLAIQRAQAALALAELHLSWAAGQTATINTAGLLSGQTHSNSQPGIPPAPALTYQWSPNTAADTEAGCAIASYQHGHLTIWAACEPTTQLRAELATLSGVPLEAITVIMSAPPHSAGYDLAVEAALLARHAKRPVKAYADFSAGAPALSITIDSTPDGLTAQRSYHLHARPSKAALLCGISIKPQAEGLSSTLPATTPAPQWAPIGNYPGESVLELEAFAESSYWDEAARRDGKDPIEVRLERVNNDQARNLIRRVADQAEWSERQASAGDTLRGRGFAYAQMQDDASVPPRTLMSAWVVDVSVDKISGQVSIDRLTVGNDSTNTPDSPAEPARLEAGIRETVGGLLAAPPRFDDWGSETDEQAPSSALATMRVDVVNARHDVEPALEWSRATTLPAAAAIANAIHDATGIRLREAPFGDAVPPIALEKPSAGKGRGWAVAAGLAAAAAGIAASMWPWPKAIPPIASVDTSVYSLAAIERGRRIAAAGNCMVCHTAEGGETNAGGLALPTPFGTIYTTNITPDKETGIGNWSFEAFDRALRRGIHQDGSLLYPAFPYTAFSKISDGDMQSLYAYMMSQPAVKSEPVKNDMTFPFNVRELLAGWNVLFHRPEQFTPDPAQTTLWNRGAYLVEAVGHCAACHSPHNALGGQKKDWPSYLSGAYIKGWEAPALNYMTHSPNPWTEADFYEYLSTGYSARHGVASGPMAPVVQGLQELDDQDVRAIAHYLGALPAPEAVAESATTTQPTATETPADAATPVQLLAGENVFRGACAACHDASGGPALFGARPLLAVNSNIHSASPDNVIQTILHGISEPADPSLGFMPGFKNSLNDTQLADLLRYMRHEFAPDKQAWTGIEGRISELRAQPPA